MKKAWYLLFLLSSTLFLLVGCEDRVDTLVNDKTQSISTIKFEEPQKLESIVKQINKNITLIQVQTQYEIEGENFYEFTSIQNTNLEDLEKLFLDNRKQFEKDKKDLFFSDSEVPDTHRELINEFVKPSQTSDDVGVISLTVTGTEEEILEFSNKFDQVEISSLREQEKHKLELNSRELNSDWLPDLGVVETRDYDSSQRYLLQGFKWYNNPFADGETYEPDFFLDNYNVGDRKGTYFSRRNYGSFPAFSYAASNLPDAYVDTRFSDSSNEVAYTIGCGDANNIDTDETYYTYLRLGKGDVDFDQAKLSGQLGEQRPYGCVSTWCSFSTGIEKIIPAWDLDVPSTRYW